MSYFDSISAAKKPKAKEELWLISYADLVTNLMAFFIMLLSMSKYDAVKMNAVTKEISRVRADTLDKLEAKLMEGIKAGKLEGRVSVQLQDFGLNVEFRGDRMFDSGTDTLTPEFRKELAPVLGILAKMEEKYSIALEGHTDDVPLVGSRHFKDNWGLSSARGVSLMQEFARLGVPHRRMNIAGFADTRPKEDPKPLLEALKKPGADRKALEEKLRAARSHNRRVVVRVYQ